MLFFNRKRRLVDSGVLGGMVDCHSHLLWGVDDGSKDDTQTRRMVGLLQQIGINAGFATPHVMASLPQNTTQKLKTAFEERLLPICSELGFGIKLAAEYLLDEAFGQKLNADEAMLAYDGSHLLVEMSYAAQPASFYEMMYEVELNGYTPVLAHPERYSFMSFGELAEIKERGCKFQLNILSLGDEVYGSRVNRAALKLLEADMYDLVGTDAHSEKMVRKIHNISCSPAHVKKLEKIIRSCTIGIG